MSFHVLPLCLIHLCFPSSSHYINLITVTTVPLSAPAKNKMQKWSQLYLIVLNRWWGFKRVGGKCVAIGSEAKVRRLQNQSLSLESMKDVQGKETVFGGKCSLPNIISFYWITQVFSVTGGNEDGKRSHHCPCSIFERKINFVMNHFCINNLMIKVYFDYQKAGFSLFLSFFFLYPELKCKNICFSSKNW